MFITIANTPPRAALDMNIGASNPPDVPDPSEITSASALKTAMSIKHLQSEVVVENIRDRVVSHAQHARNEIADDSQSQRTDRRMPQIVDSDPVELILHPIQQLRESDCHDSANHSEKQVKGQSPERTKISIAHREHRPLAQQNGTHTRRQRACNHQRNKRA